MPDRTVSAIPFHGAALAETPTNHPVLGVPMLLVLGAQDDVTLRVVTDLPPSLAAGPPWAVLFQPGVPHQDLGDPSFVCTRLETMLRRRIAADGSLRPLDRAQGREGWLRPNRRLLVESATFAAPTEGLASAVGPTGSRTPRAPARARSPAAHQAAKTPRLVPPDPSPRTWPMHNDRIVICALAAALLAWAPRACAAAASPFPAGANLVDVTAAPYGADPSGARDSTAAIQKALDDSANGNCMVFLPAGTYRVSDTLRWGKGSRGGLEQKRTILQGAGRDATVIRLADNSPGFQNTAPRDGQPAGAKPVVWTGQKPAQRFRNGIRDLTVDTGRGNPGATAVQFMANNQGSVRNVRLVAAADAGGMVGLDLGYTDEQGPCLIQDLLVDGFDTGVRLAGAVNSVTFERIVLRGQRRAGLITGGQCISVRHLRFAGACPAVVVEHVNAVVALDGLEAEGAGAAGSTAAVVSRKQGYLYARDVRTRGFRQAIDCGPGDPAGGERPSPTGAEVADFVSRDPARDRLFPSPESHLRLGVAETPPAPALAPADWASPAAFGGDATGAADSTEAVQRAIDSGRRGVCFPRGAWRIDGEVFVRGAVEVVTPHEGRLTGKGTLRFADGTAPTVRFERADLLYTDLGLVWDTRRPLVVSGVTFGKGRLALKGQGDLFIEDVCMGRLELGKGQRLWARQLNIEWPADKHPEAPEKIDNAGGQLWVLGYKTEQAGTVCRTRDGGCSVLFGGMVYAQGRPKLHPMLVVENAALSATLGEVCWNFGAQGYQVLARETRGAETRELKGGAANGRYWHANGASAVPLFSAYREK